MSGVVRALLLRDWLAAGRDLATALQPLLFFLMAGALLRVVLPASAAAELAAAAVWLLALLAAVLAADGLFREDVRNGALQQLMLSPLPHYWPALAAIIGHWSLSGLPLSVAVPLLGAAFGMPAAHWPSALLVAALGTGTLSAIGVFGAALCAAARPGSLLLALLVLPLYVPVLIFGAASMLHMAEGASWGAEAAALAALLALSWALAPLAVAGAWRIAVER